MNKALKRIWVLFVARNYEFIRDKAGFGWNILFPFLIVAGFGVIFSSDTRSAYKLGVFPAENDAPEISSLHIPEPLKTDKYVRIVIFQNREDGLDRLRHHKIDLLVEQAAGPKSAAPLRYWVSDSSPRGHVMETMLKAAQLSDSERDERLLKQEIEGAQIRYIDWLFPGILGMNIMFSSMFGVGYVIVRYRRSGVLKRLKATPVSAFEYLTAQLASRVLILMSTSFLVWFGCDFLFAFNMNGSYLDIFIVFFSGTFCLVSLGLILACRGTNEEMTNGIINFICWPMMFLSEVWFSIEGSSGWVHSIARALPLTHFLSAARKVINDGAGFAEISFEVTVLLVMSLVFLSIGSFFFSWTR